MVSNMSCLQTIGERVLLVRRQLGLNQSEFGALLGSLKKSAISAYETNENPLSVATAIKVAEIAKVSLDELLLGSSRGGLDCKECGSEINIYQSELSYFENRVMLMIRDLDPRDYCAVLELLGCIIATSPYGEEM